MNPRRIVLVRHGRSAHVHTGWIDRGGFLRWREAYEAAGLDPTDAPPPALRELAAGAGAIVSSDAPRAVASARILAPGREHLVSPLLRELDLVPPHLGPLRLPLFGWALSYGLRLLTHGQGHVTSAERERARAAARWLIALAEEHGMVVAVTHASFRSVLAKELRAEGWSGVKPRGRTRHWSAWILALPHGGSLRRAPHGSVANPPSIRDPAQCAPKGQQSCQNFRNCVLFARHESWDSGALPRSKTAAR